MRDRSTHLGRDGESRFPRTSWSVVRDASDPRSETYQQSLGRLAGTYWRPVYAYFRRRWNASNEEAKDMTQEFFCRLSERPLLGGLTRDGALFRSYVMTLLDNMAKMAHRRRTALKRGGGQATVSIDFGDGFEPASPQGDPQQLFTREWSAALLNRSLEDLQAEYSGRGQTAQFELFVRHDIAPDRDSAPDQGALAAELGLTRDAVRNSLYRTRKRLRSLVRQHVRDTVTCEEDLESEMKALFGAGY